MRIGYILLRNSEEANLLAREQLKQAGCQVIYTDRDSAFSSLSFGDTLVIPRLKALAKSRLLFVESFNLLEKKGVHLQSLDENLFFSSKFMVLESWNLIDKVFPLKKKKKSDNSPRNKPKEQGRPPTKKDTLKLIKLLKKDRHKPNITKICQIAGICRQTYYNYFPKRT